MSGECIESGENGWRMSGECIESGQFSKMAILASTRIRQNWRIFGEYSNLTNSPASGHCLTNTHKLSFVKEKKDFPKKQKEYHKPEK
jgi:hypothetical protein